MSGNRTLKYTNTLNVSWCRTKSIKSRRPLLSFFSNRTSIANQSKFSQLQNFHHTTSPQRFTYLLPHPASKSCSNLLISPASLSLSTPQHPTNSPDPHSQTDPPPLPHKTPKQQKLPHPPPPKKMSNTTGVSPADIKTTIVKSTYTTTIDVPYAQLLKLVEEAMGAKDRAYCVFPYLSTSPPKVPTSNTKIL